MAAARDRLRADVFNYASMAHNNEFFFRGVVKDATPVNAERPDLGVRQPTQMPPELVRLIEMSYGSVETFKMTFLQTALGMFGPGFVWLCLKGSSLDWGFTIVTTYLAGSPYKEAHNKRQSVDTNTVGGRKDDEDVAAVFGEAKSIRGPHRQGRAPGGADLQPLLCVCTWEHVWLPDYGMYLENEEASSGFIYGKEKYLDAWWDVVDWNLVYGELDNHPKYKS